MRYFALACDYDGTLAHDGGVDEETLRRFAQMVREEGLNVTVRDTRGREGDAACGQLRARVLAEGPPTA